MKKMIKPYDGYQFSRDIRMAFTCLDVIILGLMLTIVCIMIGFNSKEPFVRLIMLVMTIFTIMLATMGWYRFLDYVNRMWYA